MHGNRTSADDIRSELRTALAEVRQVLEQHGLGEQAISLEIFWNPEVDGETGGAYHQQHGQTQLWSGHNEWRYIEGSARPFAWLLVGGPPGDQLQQLAGKALMNAALRSLEQWSNRSGGQAWWLTKSLWGQPEGFDALIDGWPQANSPELAAFLDAVSSERKQAIDKFGPGLPGPEERKAESTRAKQQELADRQREKEEAARAEALLDPQLRRALLDLLEQLGMALLLSDETAILTDANDEAWRQDDEHNFIAELSPHPQWVAEVPADAPPCACRPGLSTPSVPRWRSER